jgi:hypothetical protein
MYLFQLAEMTPIKFNTSVTVKGGSYWLAVGNFETGRWELAGPLDASGYEYPTLPAAQYKSDGNLAVIAVLAGRMGGADADIAVERIVLTAGNGSSNEL